MFHMSYSPLFCLSLFLTATLEITLSPPKQFRRFSPLQGHWISNLNSPWPCNLTYSQVLGIRSWTFLEESLFTYNTFLVQRDCLGNSLAVQWLRFHDSTAGGPRSIPGQGTKIPQATVVVQSLSHIQLLMIPWTAACQASLSFTISWNLLKLLYIESAIPSNHLILCYSLFLLPSIFPSIRVFSNELTLCIKWPKY